MSSHLEAHQLSTAVADEEEDVEGLEGQRLDDEQVGGQIASAWLAYSPDFGA